MSLLSTLCVKKVMQFTLLNTAREAESFMQQYVVSKHTPITHTRVEETSVKHNEPELTLNSYLAPLIQKLSTAGQRVLKCVQLN